MLNKAKIFFSFVIDLYRNKQLIFDLAKDDLKKRFTATFFGMVWAYMIPLVNIFVFWFVFQVGLRNAPIDNIPFIVWFLPAYVPWMLISEVLSSAPNCLYEYSYLIKKVKFRTSILPIVKLLSALFLHSFFILVVFAINIIYKRSFTLQWLQSIYYTFAASIFLMGVSWILSSLAVFSRDIGNLVTVIIQIEFWLTPIVWNIENVDKKLHFLFKLNPVMYITEGYRDSFLYGIWFWERPSYMIYFWTVTIILFLLGGLVFNKLRPQFADVI